LFVLFAALLVCSASCSASSSSSPSVPLRSPQPLNGARKSGTEELVVLLIDLQVVLLVLVLVDYSNIYFDHNDRDASEEQGRNRSGRNAWLAGSRPPLLPHGGK
jgi:hypothetical protein